MQSILVVGAGREGKGFLGETFSTDGCCFAKKLKRL